MLTTKNSLMKNLALQSMANLSQVVGRIVKNFI